MEPETIEIKVAEYYDQPKYYGDMPEAVFNALEAAFISGAETAIVPKAAFEMIPTRTNGPMKQGLLSLGRNGGLRRLR